MSTRLAAALISCFLFQASSALAQILPPGEEPPSPPGGGGGGGSGGKTGGLQPVTPEAVEQILKDVGLKQVELTKWNKDQALRIPDWQGYKVHIAFRFCEEAGCKDIWMITWFKAPKFVDLAWVNKWHGRRAYARIRLDDAKNLYFEMYVNCVGGVTRDNIIANLSMYEQQLKNLKETK